MIPILYETTETAFTTNGIGRLVDAISCIVTEERNGPYELEMQYPITGQYFSELTHSRIICAVPADGKSSQPFRIYRISKPLDGICTVYAEHISYQLNHIPVMPFTATSCATALAGLKSHAGQTCPFTVWTDKSVVGNYAVEEPRSFRELLGGSSGSILDVYGKGEYEFDKWAVKLYVNRGVDSGVVIRYAKNLTELVNDENIETVYTGVCPYWKNNESGALVTLPEVAVYADTAADYPYKRTKIIDASEQFEDAPTVAQLRAWATNYITNNDIGIPKVNIDFSFVPLSQTYGASVGYPQAVLVLPSATVNGNTVEGVDGSVTGNTLYLDGARWAITNTDYRTLERVHLCDTITVVYDALGVSATAKVIKTVYDVLRDRYESLEVGDARSNLAQQIVDIEESITNPTINLEITEELEEYVKHQTALITGGLGGYVVMQSSTGGETPDEILIMDTADPSTATNVIRMNRNGIGFSTNGYSGPYSTAWTIDGVFNASFIGAGQLSANYIHGGTIDATDVNITNLNANNITSGTLAANHIKLGGQMNVYTSASSTTVGGSIGYMSGATSSTDRTNGIAIMDSNGANHIIATDNGVRMTNVSSDKTQYASLYMTNGQLHYVSTFTTPAAYLQGDIYLNNNGTAYSGTTYCGPAFRVMYADASRSAFLFRANDASGSTTGYGEAFMNDTGGKRKAYVGRQNDAGFIGVYSGNNVNAANMGADSSGAGVFRANTATGTTVATVTSVSGAGGAVNCYNESSNAVASLVGRSDGGRLLLANSSGYGAANIVSTTTGGYIQLADNGGAMRVYTYANTNGGFLRLYDSSGNYSNLTKELIDEITAGIRIISFQTVSVNTGSAIAHLASKSVIANYTEVAGATGYFGIPIATNNGVITVPANCYNGEMTLTLKNIAGSGGIVSATILILAYKEAT